MTIDAHDTKGGEKKFILRARAISVGWNERREHEKTAFPKFKTRLRNMVLSGWLSFN
jgi:hypothetical protein